MHSSTRYSSLKMKMDIIFNTQQDTESVLSVCDLIIHLKCDVHQNIRETAQQLDVIVLNHCIYAPVYLH